MSSNSICLDLKCSNTSNHRWPVSVPHIRDVLLLSANEYQKRPNKAM